MNFFYYKLDERSAKYVWRTVGVELQGDFVLAARLAAGRFSTSFPPVPKWPIRLAGFLIRTNI